MSKNIVVFTECYPYEAVTEEVFVEPDIDALSKIFDRVFVVPMTGAGNLKDISRWTNVTVDTSLAHSFLQNSRLIKSVYLFHPFVLRHLRTNISEAESISQFYQGCSFNLNTVTIARSIKGILNKYHLSSDNTVLYTFWFLYETSALSYLSKNDDWKIVSRAHGHDVYENNRWGVFISTSMRKRILQDVQAVYPVSQAAREHMCERHPEFAHKIQVRRLGSRRLYDVRPHTLLTPDREIVLLSVARVVPIKRVLLNLQVMEALATAHPDMKFKWIHIGDGANFPELKTAVNASHCGNLTVELRGKLSNRRVQEVYRDMGVDIFFLLSTDEGLPISICEAMSYGVSVVVTDVGGNREIVNEGNGIVVNIDATADEIASRISVLLKDSVKLNELGAGALKTWEEGFNERELRKDFARELLDMIYPNKFS